MNRREPEFKTELRRAGFAGLFMALILIPYSFALAALIFNGPLQPFVVPGSGLLIIGTIVTCLIFGLASSYRGVLAGPQEIPAAALGTMSAAVAASMANVPVEATFTTMITLLALTSVLTGLVFLGLGLSRLSYLLRFIPYPVSAGCFAGFGWILCVAAFSMTSSLSLDWQTLPRLFESNVIWKWIPGFAYGIVLFLVMRRRNSIAILIWSFLLLTGVFHLVLFVFDVSIVTARAENLLWSGVGANSDLWSAFSLYDLGLVDWGVVGDQVPAVTVVVLLMVLCLLLNTNIMEVASAEEIDLDREFRVAGVSSIVTGAGGSPPGAHFPVLSVTSQRLGAGTRWTGIFTAAWLCLVYILGSTFLELIPVSLTGGLILFFGIDLLNSWLIKVRRRVSRLEYAVILLMALVIIVFGFVEGVIFGLLASFGPLFIYLVRLDPVVTVETGANRRSSKVRSVPDRGILLLHNERIKIVKLCGYMYFVINYRLMNHLKKLLGQAPPGSFIVLDCTEVEWFDASAINVLSMFLKTNEVKVVFASPPLALKTSLVHDFPDQVRERVWFDNTLDHALERCEDMILKSEVQKLDVSSVDDRSDLLKRVGDDLEEHLVRQIRFENLIEQLNPWLERCEYGTGSQLAGPDCVHDGMELVVSGRISVNDTTGSRLFQYGPGNVVEPAAAFEPRNSSFSVFAEEPCVTMKLTPASRRILDAEMPDLSRRLYRYVLTDDPHSVSSLSSQNGE